MVLSVPNISTASICTRRLQTVWSISNRKESVKNAVYGRICAYIPVSVCFADTRYYCRFFTRLDYIRILFKKKAKFVYLYNRGKYSRVAKWLYKSIIDGIPCSIRFQREYFLNWTSVLRFIDFDPENKGRYRETNLFKA